MLVWRVPRGRAFSLLGHYLQDSRVWYSQTGQCISMSGLWQKYLFFFFFLSGSRTASGFLWSSLVQSFLLLSRWHLPVSHWALGVLPQEVATRSPSQVLGFLSKEGSLHAHLPWTTILSEISRQQQLTTSNKAASQSTIFPPLTTQPCHNWFSVDHWKLLHQARPNASLLPASLFLFVCFISRKIEFGFIMG